MVELPGVGEGSLSYAAGFHRKSGEGLLIVQYVIT